MSAQAHARRSDPLTSHKAAEAVTPGLTALQQIVEQVAIKFPDGFTDVDLTWNRSDQQGSTLRTRRAELTARNIILDSGQRVIPEGHSQRHTVWIHRRFVDDAPPLVDPEPPVGASDKARALELLPELENGARQMRAEGRTIWADHLDECARVMRRLAK